MPTDVLPTAEQLGLVVHRLFVALRNKGLGGQVDARELAEVADVAELIGLQFINRDEDYLRHIVTGLRDLAARYPGAGFYAAPLDMTLDEVTQIVPKRTRQPDPITLAAAHAAN